MKRSVIQILLLLYPAKWRNEYGAELEGLLFAERLRFTVVLNVVASALRQQARISNHPAGLIRSLAFMTGGIGGVFVLSMILSRSLFTLMILPMRNVLTQSGGPHLLVQSRPWEGFAIVWLGLPLLITAFVAYPVVLGFVRLKVAYSWPPRRKRWATAFAICSGGMCFLGGVSGFVAWQHGLALTIAGVEPLMLHPSTTSISACFVKFTRSMLEFGILLQAPVFVFFMSRINKCFAETDPK